MTRKFEVFRMEKLPTEGAVIRSLRHDLDMSYENEKGETVYYRKTRDANKEKKNQYDYQNYTDENGEKKERSKEQRFQLALKNFRKKMPKKKRKNAVVGAQCIFSFSHELLKDKNFKYKEYFKDCEQFVYKHFKKENVFNWACHLDEQTPHITFQFVPKDDDGKLNARKIFGNKKTLSEWQDKFHEEVGKKYGLERGIRKTSIIHETLRSFYGKLKNLDEDLDKMEITKKKLGESWEDYFTRTKAELKSFVEPMLKPLATLDKEIQKYENAQKSLENEKEKSKEELEAEKKLLEADREALTHAQEHFDDKLQEAVEKRLGELLPDIQKEFESMYVPKDLVFSKGEKTVNFHKKPYSELAKELASFYLDDEKQVHERKREIELEFQRNRVQTRN